LRRRLHPRHLRLRPRPPVGISWAHRRFVERRGQGKAARAGRRAGAAGRGEAAVARTSAFDGVLDQMAAAGSLTRSAPASRREGKDGKDPKAPWRAYLQRKGLKTTQQREAIVDAFLRSSGHVALEDLLSSA